MTAPARYLVTARQGGEVRGQAIMDGKQTALLMRRQILAFTRMEESSADLRVLEALNRIDRRVPPPASAVALENPKTGLVLVFQKHATEEEA